MSPKRELYLAGQRREFPEGKTGQEQYEPETTPTLSLERKITNIELFILVRRTTQLNLFKTTRPGNDGFWGREWELSCQATPLSQAFQSDANSSEFNYIATVNCRLAK